MTLYFVEQFKLDNIFDFDYKEVARTVINKTLIQEHFNYDVEVSITLLGENDIKDINREYRDIDKKTDVLSFPMIEYDSSYSTCSDRTEEMYEFIEDSIDAINPDTDEIILGDIVLCVPVILEQAKEYNHSILREYAFLIAHSMLHLLGYDHMNEKERLIMEKKQNLILESLNITRDL
ncbi:MAG TPA: rRNA maturation RNase YbeY [Lachnospiraceae bacterium]|nr:rRNA maturation RNase YbeY [Lachnospiraceae bacterium]